ncbi:hypothetical protein M2451_002080 [Dysgonomonas sp. PFB1-18]|uniref:porin family protein n=1 Tax=unclassified Dysgonomonas TaxID=2630389 RepID=UPI0024748E0F|nr:MULTISPECIES: porin family protein [unclassified Dysgonomonas]MDH6309736.1 hypothetical protein [Dysgonomonas sp. PF1-14]MDH6339256.1 hypothetical protein [Dysgonomonas sp. PF1-16]MDH6380755.1 hypothetical protein [Dysgonomonas sp. PFB1-18]MDH6398251.1 hypothetical protein [Dysgonomonas sp. PF1-23]
MIKKRILLYLFILVPFALYAQWGVKGGLDYCTLVKHDLSNYRLGFHIGPTYDFYLSEKIYLQPSVLFSYFQFGFESDEYIVKGSVERYNLEIPVNLSFRQPLSENTKLIIDLGPYLKCGLFGDSNYDYKNNTINEFSTYDIYSRFEFGLNVGGGIEIDKIYAGLAYQYGLTGATGKNSRVNNQLFRFSLGYKF